MTDILYFVVGLLAGLAATFFIPKPKKAGTILIDARDPDMDRIKFEFTIQPYEFRKYQKLIFDVNPYADLSGDNSQTFEPL